MLDKKFTQQIIDFLDIEKPTDDEIRNGAMMLLQINRNRLIYQNVVMRPQKQLERLRYELNKHLTARLDGHSIQDVREMDEKTLGNISDIITNDVPEDIELEEEDTEDKVKRHGKRKDHDTLPVAIQQLWDKNVERWKKMKELYYTCCELEKSCDRYEYVKLLADGYEHYREDMQKYDEWTPGEKTVTAIDAKDIGNARSYLSNNRRKYEDLIAEGDEKKIKSLHDKIQERVDLLTANNAEISQDVQTWLIDNNFNLGNDKESDDSENA